VSDETAAPGRPAEVDGNPYDEGTDNPAAADHGTQRAGGDPARAALARAKADADARRRSAGGPAARPAVPRGSRRESPAGANDGPELFGSAIRRLVDERGWTAPVQAGAVLGRWDALVGVDLAAHCRPERLDDGELVLVAESTAWATQVRLLAPAVLARLASELGAGVVRSLRVHGPTAPDWHSGPRRVTGGRGPRDTYG
jgi:predicted nucleic acid-binding Zn ribbon protein